MYRTSITDADQNERDNMADAVRGTRKLTRKTPLIDRVRNVVSTGACARVDGLLLDLTTANAIVKVHDALNETNRATFAALPLRRMAAVAWKLCK